MEDRNDGSVEGKRKGDIRREKTAKGTGKIEYCGKNAVRRRKRQEIAYKMKE